MWSTWLTLLCTSLELSKVLLVFLCYVLQLTPAAAQEPVNLDTSRRLAFEFDVHDVFGELLNLSEHMGRLAKLLRSVIQYEHIAAAAVEGTEAIVTKFESALTRLQVVCT